MGDSRCVFAISWRDDAVAKNQYRAKQYGYQARQTIGGRAALAQGCLRRRACCTRRLAALAHRALAAGVRNGWRAADVTYERRHGNGGTLLTNNVAAAPRVLRLLCAPAVFLAPASPSAALITAAARAATAAGCLPYGGIFPAPAPAHNIAPRPWRAVTWAGEARHLESI